jgi:transposase
MERIDLRKLSDKEQYMLKKQVVRLKKLGKNRTEIDEMTGINQSAVSRIWQSYLKGGTAGINPKKRGRKKGENFLLTPEEEHAIRQTIINKAPNQLKLAGFLWTLAKISQYIWTTFRQEEYPAIAKRAKAENAAIYWGDETGVDNRENFERGFAEKGKPPVLPMETKRERVNMISAITNQGHSRFMVYEAKMNQQLFIDFMRRLVRESDRKVFFIVDNLRVHHGKLVAAWLEEHKDKIELFFLPPYAPESNPDEYLNNALKHNVHSGNLPHSVRMTAWRIRLIDAGFGFVFRKFFYRGFIFMLFSFSG